MYFVKRPCGSVPSDSQWSGVDLPVFSPKLSQLFVHTIVSLFTVENGGRKVLKYPHHRSHFHISALDFSFPSPTPHSSLIVCLDNYGTRPTPDAVTGWRVALRPVSGVLFPASYDPTSLSLEGFLPTSLAKIRALLSASHGCRVLLGVFLKALIEGLTCRRWLKKCWQ